MRGTWACIAAVCAAVRLFAVQEPDGGEWQDQKQLSFGREPSRAAFFTFATEKESLALDAGFVTWKAGEPVPFSTISLDYEADDASASPWRFKWSKDPASRPVGFQSPAYDISSWEGICVPCSWQAINAKGKRKGRWGRPIYTNGIIYPFAVNPPRVMDTPPKWYTNFTERNPVGSYRRDFDVPEAWTQDEVFLKFDGVDSFFYLWVNGQYVGFSKDSRNPAEFNVKKFVKPGRNTVALEVYRNSDGSYLEDQDMFRLSGIFRHTWLIRRPANRIRDFFVTAAPVREGDFAGDWEMKVKVEGDGGGEGEGSGEVWTVSLFTLDGQPVVKKEIKNPTSSTSATPTTSATCTLHLTSPKLWNAETPNCYTVVVGNGREFASTLFGFRVSEIKNGRYYLNGQKIKLHGANRHETDPGYGHYTPRSLMEEDIRLLKRANCNAVRNSHYPQDDYWYRLCDLNGIYLVDEANMESHGMGFGKMSLAHRPEWREATVQRSLDMIARNKNHPSVIIWSYGNESGGGANFTAAGEAVREADPTRPRHYEGDNTKADIDSVMYPSVDRVWREARNAKRTRPFYLCEYAHNMVNAMGNLKDYEDAIQSSDVVIGGTIWDWVDQGLYKEVEKTGGGGEGKMIIGFGGDFGDAPNDGQFVMNGCILSDRSLEPGYFEIKHVFQPFTATPTEDGRSIRLLNRNFFRTGAYCTCEWTATVNGVGLEDARQTFVRGTFDIADLAPRATKVVPVPTEALALRGPCRTVAVRVRFLQREAEGVVEKGYVVADDQIDLKAESPAMPLVCTGGAVSVDETGDAVRFATSAGMRYGFSRKTGCLTSVVAANGEEQLLSPMALDAFRCPSSNEIRPADAALRSGLRVLSASLLSFGAVEGTKEGGQTFTTTVRYRGVRREEQSGYGNVQMTLKDRGSVRKSDAVRFTVCSRWTVLPSGELLCRSEIKGSGRAIDLLRIGYRFTLRGKKAQVSWFGRGPFENYRDRKSGAFVSRWSRPLDDLFVPYARNEDCGNMEDVSRVDVETEHGGIGFTTLARPFAFQACRWSPTELMTYTHPSDLPAVPAKAEIAILAATRGLGGRSCGPDTLARDRIGSRGTYRLDFAIGAPSSDDHTAYSHDDLPLPTVTGREPFFKPVEASSFEPHEGEICHIADGDPDTYWHTRWNGKNVPRHPHWIVLDAGKSVGLAGLTVLGRQDSNLNGTIKTLRVETSEDRVSWSIVREAKLPLSDGVQELRFAQPTTGRYVRLTALESHNGDVWAQIAEVEPILNIVGTVEAAIAAGLGFKIENDHANLIYAVGEEASFTVTVTRGGKRLAAGAVDVKLDNFGSDVQLSNRVDLARGNPFTVKGKLSEPGFLRLTLAAAGTASKVWSVGYEPEKIEKGSPSPDDFDAFWAAARAKLAKEVPLDAEVKNVPERSTKDFTFYRISFATFGRRVYGYMSVPTDKSKAPYPVEFQVSAAGFAGHSNDMNGDRHCIRVFFSVYPWEPHWKWKSLGLKASYDRMNDEYDRKYGCKHYCTAGLSMSREEYFFYPVLLGIDRAVDWLAARPDVDRTRFWYQGTSQGGGFGFYLTGLNHAFTRAAFFVPAITDTMGYLKGRQSGWPQPVESHSAADRAAVERNAPYFDGANFAARIACPVRVAVGFSDTTCAPCAVYAAYNEIKVPDKGIVHGFGMTHSCYRWFYRDLGAWLRESQRVR